MTVIELIKELIYCDLNKNVSVYMGDKYFGDINDVIEKQWDDEIRIEVR